MIDAQVDLQTPGIYFYIMRLLEIEGQMSLVQLVDKACIEARIEEPKNVKRAYMRIRSAVFALEKTNRIKTERMPGIGQGNRKIKIICLA
jgi:hypothetical protein